MSAYSMIGWVCILTIVSSLAYILDGIMVGATKAKDMRDALIIGVFLVYLPIWFVTTKSFILGISSFWLSLIALNMFRNIWLSLSAWKLAKKNFI